MPQSSVSSKSKQDDATESHFEDELLDEVPDHIGTYQGQLAGQQQQPVEHGATPKEFDDDQSEGSQSGSGSDGED